MAEAMIRMRADPPTLLKTAPFAAGPGASDGGVEMVEGEMLGVAADGSGDSEGEEVGGAGGEFPVAGEAAGDTDDGDGDNALLGGVATGVWVGDKAGDEAGD